MYKKSFAQFIRKHSTAIAINNAYFVYPEFINQQGLQFVYECVGGAILPYTIEIELDANQEIQRTSCTCPYHDKGICKHTIASIEDLADRLENSSLEMELLDLDSTSKNTKVQEWFGIVSLDDGYFNLEELKELVPIELGYRYIHFEKFDVKNIKTYISSWPKNFEQQIILSNDRTELHTACSCSNKKAFCEHRLAVFEHINEEFGSGFFREGFFDATIAQALSSYGLTLDDNYEAFFDVEISKKGIQLKHKLQDGLTEYTSALVDYEEDAGLIALLNIPITSSHQQEFGVGLCLDFTKYYSKKEYLSFFPIKGKYNKDLTDLGSKISRIFIENFTSIIDDFPDSDDFNFVSDALRMERLLVESEVGARQKSLDIFNKLIEQRPDALFMHDTKKTYARKNLTRLKIVDESLKLLFKISDKQSYFEVTPRIEIAETKYNIDSSKIIVTPLFVLLGDELIPIKTPKLSFDLMHFIKNPKMNFFKKDLAHFHKNIVTPLSKDYEVEAPFIKKEKTKIKDKVAQEKNLEKQVYISDLAEGYVVFKPFVKYEEVLVPVYSNEVIAIDFDANNEVVYLNRNIGFEDNFLEELRKLHPDFENQDAVFYLQPEKLLENYWLMTAVEKMKSAGINVFGANDLKSFKFNINKPTISMRLESDIDWFDIKIDVKFGEQTVALKDLQKAFIKQNNYVLLNDGTTGILPQDWMRKFAVYFQTGEVKKDRIQMSNFQFGVIDELYEELHEKPEFLEQLFQKKQRLLNLKEIPNVQVPKGIKATLRDYQQEGLNWLVFFDENKLGGCLADDMGLGKTLQTIVFLQYLKTKNSKIPPTLIVAPTSLIFNWQAEIKKFCPTLKTLSFTGANRMEHKDSFAKYDIILSTYGSLLNDIEFLKNNKFNYVILDESQAIKNPMSMRYKAVRLLNANNRLVLTGTPIENNTFDLYAQLNFLNPGLLGTMTHFKKSFSDYIDKENDEEVSKTLSRIINPFVLRRTKEQVATELPEKIESVIYCEMKAPQRKVYDAYKNKFRDYLLKQIEDNGVASSQMYILEGLTKLRQICNSTALINDEEDYGNNSIKLDTLTETIKEKTGNHKILVFSQFVGMLQLIKNRLESENIVYEYLDGSTRDRQTRVDNFQNNPEVRVFLISLKAGGTGLNLTEADYVFLVDPWWNPAVENQAIDRCYRIGQNKKVMAYRMICKDTIEEKIVSLQSKKKSVASSIISIDEQQKSFNVADIKRLFS